jgi:hypothetical protein
MGVPFREELEFADQIIVEPADFNANDPGSPGAGASASNDASSIFLYLPCPVKGSLT